MTFELARKKGENVDPPRTIPLKVHSDAGVKRTRPRKDIGD
jgi:hypothetical protein